MSKKIIQIFVIFCFLCSNLAFAQSNIYNSSNLAEEVNSAKVYLSQKQNIKSIEMFKKIVEKTNDCALLNDIASFLIVNFKAQDNYEANNLYETIGDIYIKTGDNKKAYAAYKKAIQYNPDDIYLKYVLSDLLAQNSEYEQAIEVYDSILRDIPNDSQIKLAKKDAQDKEQYIKEQEQKQEQEQKYLAEIEKKRLEEKELKEKQKQQELEKQRQEEQERIIKQKQQELEKQKQQEQIRLEQQKQEKLRQEKLQAENVQQEKLRQEKLRQEKLRQQQIKTQTQKTQTQKAQIQKQTQTLTQAQYSQKAIEEVKLAQAKNPKKYAQYKKIIDSYLNVNPKTKDNYIAAANTYRQMGMNVNALNYYKQAQKLDPNNSDIYYFMGLIYLELNDLNASKACLEQALNLNSSNTKAKNLSAFVNQKMITNIVNSAYTKYEAKQYQQAYDVLNDGIKKFPKSAYLYYYRAVVSDKTGKYTSAISDLNQAIELDSSHCLSFYLLGKIYEKMHDGKNALISYERFLSTEPDDMELVDEVQKKVIEMGKRYY